MNRFTPLLVLASLCAALCMPARAALPVTSGEYKLPAAVDPLVTSDLATELWAQVWQPSGGGPYPLVVLLHGNHSTCGHVDPGNGQRYDDNNDYTYTGICPPGYVVAPSHMGYAYLAADLAAQGYVVVSVNANRGVNAAPGVSGDSGLNLRRGRLILRHLQYLAGLSAGTQSPPPGSGINLLGQLDVGHIGLMGHSRGGEGMRAAVAQYKDPGSVWPGLVGPVNFDGLFEIAPVDGQTSRTLDAAEMAWNVLIGGCDGDVYDWEGVHVFDRMLLSALAESQRLQKSSFLVYGANHNYFNTEWQQSDAAGCINQSPFYSQSNGDLQRLASKTTLLDFMAAFVGPGKQVAKAVNFDPSYPLNPALPTATTYARGFTATPLAAANFIVDNFDRDTGTSSEGVPNQSHGQLAYQHGAAGATAHQSYQRAAELGWTTPNGNTWLQVNATADGVAANVSAYPTLEFRVMLKCPSPSCVAKPARRGDVNFSLALVHADGSLSKPLALKSKALVRWAGGTAVPIEMLQTVRIASKRFTGFDPSRFHGVRFSFDKVPATRTVYVADLRFTQAPAGPLGLLGLDGEEMPSDVAQAGAEPALLPMNDSNRIVAVQSLAATVEIELLSSRPFPVGGALPELHLGNRVWRLSRVAGAHQERLIFTLPADEYAAVVAGVPVQVRIGGAPRWSFGLLAK